MERPKPGADEYEHATTILSLCHDIFTDCSVFLHTFPFVKERQFWSTDVNKFLVIGHGTIPGKFHLKINRSMKTS